MMEVIALATTLDESFIDQVSFVFFLLATGITIGSVVYGARYTSKRVDKLEKHWREEFNEMNKKIDAVDERSVQAMEKLGDKLDHVAETMREIVQRLSERLAQHEIRIDHLESNDA